jgi:hypothetical protein
MAGYKPSHSGLGELLRGVELQQEMRRRAEKIKEAAEVTAPVGPPSDPHRGLYKASFEVDSGVMRDVQGNLRAYGKVTNTTDYAVAVEYGTGGRAVEPAKSAHHTLTRAMDFAKE